MSRSFIAIVVLLWVSNAYIIGQGGSSGSKNERIITNELKGLGWDFQEVKEKYENFMEKYMQATASFSSLRDNVIGGKDIDYDGLHKELNRIVYAMGACQKKIVKYQVAYNNSLTMRQTSYIKCLIDYANHFLDAANCFVALSKRICTVSHGDENALSEWTWDSFQKAINTYDEKIKAVDTIGERLMTLYEAM